MPTIVDEDSYTPSADLSLHAIEGNLRQREQKKDRIFGVQHELLAVHSKCFEPIVDMAVGLATPPNRPLVRLFCRSQGRFNRFGTACPD